MHFVGVIARTYAYFGRGSGPIHMDSVGCTGLESRLLDCNYDSITTEDTHAKDAGVQCQQR